MEFKTTEASKGAPNITRTPESASSATSWIRHTCTKLNVKGLRDAGLYDIYIKVACSGSCKFVSNGNGKKFTEKSVFDAWQSLMDPGTFLDDENSALLEGTMLIDTADTEIFMDARIHAKTNTNGGVLDGYLYPIPETYLEPCTMTNQAVNTLPFAGKFVRGGFGLTVNTESSVETLINLYEGGMKEVQLGIN